MPCEKGKPKCFSIQKCKNMIHWICPGRTILSFGGICVAIDLLQAKIKKQGRTLMLDLSILPDAIPPVVQESAGNLFDAYREYGRKLLQGLKTEICAVRFRLLHFALMGQQGIELLSELLKYASSQGYYTLLDLPGLMSPEEAAFGAGCVWSDESVFPCDGILVSGYPGSDIIKPFLPYCEKNKKDLFVVVRTPHRSSSEIQDLLAGSRTVHMAAADNVNRYGGSTIGKFGYSRVGIVAAATAGDSVKMLRAKYPGLFMIVDGLDCSGANARNCSYGFDKMGHGAIVCLGSSVTSAWKEADEDYIPAAIAAAQRARKRIERYVTVL